MDPDLGSTYSAHCPTCKKTTDHDNVTGQCLEH
jgi:hypothetical protein